MATLPQDFPQAPDASVEQLFQSLLNRKHEYTSRVFVWLFVFQWFGVILIAAMTAPLSWAGTVSTIHIHVWSALIFGTLITSLPLYLAWTQPGAVVTRHMVAIGQMLMGALLIHVSGGRIESHFHVFVSLAFLTFYRDARVILTATVVVASDHVFRGIWFPQSVYGVLTPQIWRSVEHALWVVFEDVILLISCRQSVESMRALASRQGALEQMNSFVESRVTARTHELEVSRRALTVSESHYRNLFEDSPAGMYRTDPQGRVLLANPTLLKMVDYSSVEELQAVRFTIGKNAENVGSSPRSFRATWKRKGGGDLLVEGATRPVFDEQNQVSYYEGTVEDITERTRAERLESDRNKILELVGQNLPVATIIDEICTLVSVQVADSICSIRVAPEAADRYGEWRRQLVSSTGAVLGTLTVELRSPRVQLPGEAKAVEQACHLAVIAIEHDQLCKQMAHQAFHDALTGLPNRASFENRLLTELAAARENDYALALISVDLNRFKQINDTLGHRVGDALLREVSRRLRPLFGPQDTVARMGGDEYGIILRQGPGLESVAQVAEDVLTCFNDPFSIERHELAVTASLGISRFPGDGESSAELISHAGIALNHARKLGGNQYVQFEPAMAGDLLRRANLEKHIKTALQNGEFEILYQPQVSLARENCCAIVGAEALLRWNSPVLGRIPPSDFIPVAEEGGYIVPIGAWVISQACQQNVNWIRSGLPPFCVAVNVSAIQFSRPDFVLTVETILAETGMDPRLLELEITETSVMQNLDYFNTQMKRLREIGVKIAIDDFGTGYCSLSYVQSLAADTLKVDQSFVRGPSSETAGGRGILQAIINMARALNLQVVAEGVETEDQLLFLEESGCDIAQGFLLSKPLASGALQELLVSNGNSRVIYSLARALAKRGRVTHSGDPLRAVVVH